MIKKMSLAWIAVNDINASKKFFKDTLGLDLINDAPEHGWMELKAPHTDFTLGVGQARADHETEKAGMNAVVTMTVDDIVKSKAALEAKGVKFIDEIIEVPGHVKMVTFVDRDGNKFQLVQELN